MLNLTQPLRQAVQLTADSPATLFENRKRSWAEIESRVSRLAGALSSIDVRDDDRVAVLALNSDRYFELYYAIWWVGGVIVPLNTRWNSIEMVYAIKDSAPTTLFVDEHFSEQAKTLLDSCDSIEHVVYIGDDGCPPGMSDYEKLIDTNSPAVDSLRTGSALAGIFYTGGTTGFPKGVMLSHGGLYVSALGSIAGCLPRLDNYVYLYQAPMFHLAGAAMIIVGTMVQAQQAIIDQFTPSACLAAIETYKVRHTLFVPTMLSMVLDHPDFDNYDLSSLGAISYGASPMPESLLRETMRRLPGIELWQGYGQTELSPLATSLRPEDHVVDGPNSQRLRSAGRALPHCEVDVVDENLLAVQTGVIGQIRVRGANAMLGYWKLPKETQETLIDGWVLTGDAGYLDEHGYLFLVDRVKDMIISGGENVYSVEVENAIMEHCDVVQCAVIGIPHDKWVEKVHAVVVPKLNRHIEEQDIIDHCHNYIAGYKCPRSVEVRTEPLPLSGAGKVLKTELRKAYSVSGDN